MARQDILSPEDVLAFWQDAGAQRWFRADPAFDETCSATFAASWAAAAAGDLDAWSHTADGALALVLLLDQMPRNMFRGTPKAYETDRKARDVASRALAKGFVAHVPAPLRRFFHLPFSHAEDLADQERAVQLAGETGDADALKWARHHRDVIARFGRFPHRNAILGRTSSPEEIAWLDQEGAFKG